MTNLSLEASSAVLWENGYVYFQNFGGFSLYENPVWFYHGGAEGIDAYYTYG